MKADSPPHPSFNQHWPRPWNTMQSLAPGCPQSSGGDRWGALSTSVLCGGPTPSWGRRGDMFMCGLAYHVIHTGGASKRDKCSKLTEQP